ncbi:MAG: PepSY domain-containing protein, partial [Clostridia bacterium]|nr:PepSY domain-containing protein [Clostridia bacterium]
SRPTTTVSLDVNPALSISLNKDETVLAVTPRNEEARAVVGDMELAGNDLTLVVNALIGSMLRQGYLDDSHNSILVSVEDTDARRGEALQKKLAGQIDGLLHTDTLDGAVLSQTVDAADGELKTLAEKYGISLGKARLIQQIVAQDARHTFDELVGLTVHELNLISSDGTGSKLETVTANGTASDKGYIGVEAAKTAAVFDAIGDTEPQITWLDAVEMDYENGRMVYEVEFAVMGVEYDYAIDALTGAVVKKETDTDDEDDRRPATTTTGKPSSTTTAGKPTSTTTAGKPTSTTAAGSAAITAEQAKAAALAHAGVKAADIRDYGCELDREDGVLVYDIEFSAGDWEYEYRIDATTGKVLEGERDKEDR